MVKRYGFEVILKPMINPILEWRYKAELVYVTAATMHSLKMYQVQSGNLDVDENFKKYNV